MKKTAYLINIARGEVVDESALIQALEQKQIRGAALDVFETEPPAARIAGLSNVICTAHIGGATYESIRRIEEMTYQNIKRFIEKQQPIKTGNGDKPRPVMFFEKTRPFLLRAQKEKNSGSRSAIR